MFIAEQVQREASSTIQGAGWLQHCCEGNTITHQGTKTKTQKGEETLQGLRKLLFFPPCSILLRCIRQKTFPQHNRFVIQKVPWQNNGAFTKRTADIKFISVAFKNIMRSGKNIFQAMKHIVFTEADWRAPLSQSHSRVSKKCEANFEQNLGKFYYLKGFYKLVYEGLQVTTFHK